MKHYPILLLFLVTILKSQNYRGSELRTLEPVLYGKFESRYKPAQGDGLVSSFLHLMIVVVILALGMKLI